LAVVGGASGGAVVRVGCTGGRTACGDVGTGDSGAVETATGGDVAPDGEGAADGVVAKTDFVAETDFVADGEGLAG
jgi:hypothetical protein